MLSEERWRERARAHAERVRRYTEPHLARRSRGERHPVHDFLFGYYSYRPAELARWHPGHGVALAGAAEFVGRKGYRVVDGEPAPVVALDPAYVESQRPLVTRVHRLLVATASRPAQLGCFGLHEWAMVYRLDEDRTRHPAHPLRLGAAGTDRVVESHRIACSHFDAFRFFTPAARPHNRLSPGRDDRVDFEQSGCLHAGMDLYKHAFRLSPMVGSDLVADAFELAWEIRDLDMRASPYDLRDLGFDPVPIETPEGKQTYVAAQRRFAERGDRLRERLIGACEDLLDPAASPS